MNKLEQRVVIGGQHLGWKGCDTSPGAKYFRYATVWIAFCVM